MRQHSAIGTPVRRHPEGQGRRARKRFCWGATVFRATTVGLGLSLATVQQQDLGHFSPCQIEALLL